MENSRETSRSWRWWPWIIVIGLAVLAVQYRAHQAARQQERAGDRASPESLLDGGLLSSELLTDRIDHGGGTGSSTDPTEPPPFYGFCPQETAPFPRPSMLTIVNERLAELTDRTQNVSSSKRGSPALRRGLEKLFPATVDSHQALPILSEAPDRREEEFDFAAAAALVLGARAFKSGDYTEAASWSLEASRLDDSDPASFALLGSASLHLSDSRSARNALGRAFELAPDEPGIAVALGRILSRTEELDVAIEALDAYLATARNDAVIAGLRARIEIRAEMLRDFSRDSRAGVTLRWSPEVSDALAEEAHRTVLDSLDNAATLLRVERRQELTVFVYAARADILAATCVQSWARAVYDGALHLDGESLEHSTVMARNIAHESLHAQLHDATPGAPLWFQEGLAQYIAHQRSAGHDRSYRFMVENHTWIPFASLEGSFQVISDSGDAQLAYHQSLAMVDLLVERRGERVFNEAISFLRQGGEGSALLSHLIPPNGPTGSELIEFLEGRSND